MDIALFFRPAISTPIHLIQWETNTVTVDPEAWIILTTGNDHANDLQPIPFHPFPSPTNQVQLALRIIFHFFAVFLLTTFLEGFLKEI
jgi:hypothetical protein